MLVPPRSSRDSHNVPLLLGAFVENDRTSPKKCKSMFFGPRRDCCRCLAFVGDLRRKCWVLAMLKPPPPPAATGGVQGDRVDVAGGGNGGGDDAIDIRGDLT